MLSPTSAVEPTALNFRESPFGSSFLPIWSSKNALRLLHAAVSVLLLVCLGRGRNGVVFQHSAVGVPQRQHLHNWIRRRGWWPHPQHQGLQRGHLPDSALATWRRHAPLRPSRGLFNRTLQPHQPHDPLPRCRCRYHGHPGTQSNHF